MANVCIFTMQMTGREEDIQKAMYDIFEKDNTKLFPRTDIMMGREEALSYIAIENGIASFRLYGQCDWSMDTCLFNPKYEGSTMYEYPSLAAFSKKHSLIVEAVSVEGSIFEHGLVSLGTVEKNDAFDIEVFVEAKQIPVKFQDYKQEFEKRYEKKQEESRSREKEYAALSTVLHPKKISR